MYLYLHPSPHKCSRRSELQLNTAVVQASKFCISTPVPTKYRLVLFASLDQNRQPLLQRRLGLVSRPLPARRRLRLRRAAAPTACQPRGSSYSTRCSRRVLSCGCFVALAPSLALFACLLDVLSRRSPAAGAHHGVSHFCWRHGPQARLARLNSTRES